jgi:hypothetical protein
MTPNDAHFKTLNRDTHLHAFYSSEAKIEDVLEPSMAEEL